jgi:SAM-dependent methyltransferase
MRETEKMEIERETAPSAERNKEPILEVLRRFLPSHGLVLEIGSGTGQHVAHFAKAFPDITFQPSEMDSSRHASIAAWIRHEGLANVKSPVSFDVSRLPWPVDRADAIVCINVLHISPWAATLGLMAGAGKLLPPRGVLVTYGPYKQEGRHTAPSNESFDASLRSRDPRWGVRDLEEVAAAAKREGLDVAETIAMPANNFTLVFIRH